MTDKSQQPLLRRLQSRLTVILAVMLVMGVIFAALLYQYATTPASASQDGQVVEIKPGMTLKQVAHLLADKELLNEPSTFMLYTYLQGEQNHIQAGEYRFSPSMPPHDILEALTSGMAVLYTVTIPEGYRITDIADLLEAKGLVDKPAFIEATRNRELLESLHIPSGSLEGYLYPETYKFSKAGGARRIVQTLLDTFKERVLQPERVQQAEAMQFTFHEIVTLASLIEKETGLGKERKLISSVFHNRLAKKMRLQTDPTVIYAMVNFDGNIRKKDLSIDSPYNTYKHFGLPPGPIASPGLESIQAALDPEETDFLYFVSRKDGSHQFSTNYKDHIRAVQKYQLSHRARG
ncbi:MAG: endolytic transglycosylase MltG [Nitrospina sp.]|nr:MAG: endolytic transglycosylase MltG [Nitrospina sp.]TDJ60977.1 MAG: endolytic transglycosylase MltG [Nitrospina sp.]